MRAQRVRTDSDLRDFIALAPRLARTRGEDDRWVPLLDSDIVSWHRGTGWFAEAVELWLLRDDSGAALARTICHRSSQLSRRLADPHEAPPPTLFFGALEAADASVLDALIDLICSRARELGCRRVFGPVSPLPNVTGGLLTSGSEAPGFFDSVWTPEFYAAGFLGAGFTTWGPAHTWEVAVETMPAARATALSPDEWEAHGLRRRRVSRLRLGAFADRLLPTLNSAFAALPYYTPISPAQLKAQMSGLIALMDPALIVDVIGREDPDDAPPLCFALVIPDPLPILRRHEGRLGPAAVADLLRGRRRLRDAVLIIQGTRPEHQGRGLLSLVMRELGAGLTAGGYRRLRVTFIADDNPASAAVFAKAGGRPLHGLAFVDRTLEPDTDPRRSIDTAVIASLFAHAARSPSAHNTQPWVPRHEPSPDPTAAGVTVRVDPDRCLTAGDPAHLDLHLGMGCWVESLSIAAAEAGLDSSLSGIEGRGPDMEMRLRIVARRAETSPGSWPRFGVGDLDHRQVDRGHLERDDRAFDLAFDRAGSALADAGLRLATIPDSLWRSLLGRASLSMIAEPRIFAETLEWCRFDPRDPRYRQDGLTADCLRLSPVLAVPGSRLNSRALRPWIARIAAAAVSPVDAIQRLTTRTSAVDRPTAPHHVILVADEDQMSVRAEVEAGRALLRTWLLFDRHGLRVDVHSELKDCPETNRRLRERLGGGRPLAAFSVGRSTSPVPRSPRRL